MGYVNVIMADRKKLKSANGLYLGSTGSGKSFAAKREIINVFLTIPKDRIMTNIILTWTRSSTIPMC